MLYVDIPSKIIYGCLFLFSTLTVVFGWLVVQGLYELQLGSYVALLFSWIISIICWVLVLVLFFILHDKRKQWNENVINMVIIVVYIIPIIIYFYLLNLIDQSINYFLWVYTLVSGIFSVVSMILAISLISWRQGRQLKMSFWRS